MRGHQQYQTEAAAVQRWCAHWHALAQAFRQEEASLALQRRSGQTGQEAHGFKVPVGRQRKVGRPVWHAPGRFGFPLQHYEFRGVKNGIKLQGGLINGLLKWDATHWNHYKALFQLA
jgi:hypothetical protein